MSSPDNYLLAWSHPQQGHVRRRSDSFTGPPPDAHRYNTNYYGLRTRVAPPPPSQPSDEVASSQRRPQQRRLGYPAAQSRPSNVTPAFSSASSLIMPGPSTPGLIRLGDIWNDENPAERPNLFLTSRSQAAHSTAVSALEEEEQLERTWERTNAAAAPEVDTDSEDLLLVGGDDLDTTARDRIAFLTRMVATRSRRLDTRSTLRRFATPSNPHPVIPSALLLYKIENWNQDVSQGTSFTASRARYLPLVPAPLTPALGVDTSSADPEFTIQTSHVERINAQNSQMKASWAPDTMPVEIFQDIANHLSHDDVKNMRLVNKEFERKVSSSFFDSAVVPFNTEIYDMIEQERTKRDPSGKGKGKANVNVNINVNVNVNAIRKALPDMSSGDAGFLHWRNARDDKEGKVYKGHGLQVFRGFGQYIRNFGMSFDVKEEALQDPPHKKSLDHLQTWYGSYDWPPADYTRFEHLAGLERTADETSQMKLAFSHLRKVQKLALSLDDGLGWLNGPDRSLYSQIMRRSPTIFGHSHGGHDAQAQAQEQLWQSLQAAHRAAGTLDQLMHGILCHSELTTSLPNLPGLADTEYINTKKWASMDAGMVPHQNGTPASLTGVLYVRESDGSHTSNSKFVPSSLDRHQKEWLQEAEWAQRAFLESYMLAVVDNSDIFSRVTTLHLARLSGQYVPMLCRNDFWDALPNLIEVILCVLPDWRAVVRDSAGHAEIEDVEPSCAHKLVYRLLEEFIGPKSSVKKLHLGWASGGEHADGTLARNNHVLPAPVIPLDKTYKRRPTDEDLLDLPHLQHLVLINCYMTSMTLVALVQSLEQKSLKRLVLDSVSLTAHSSTTTDDNGQHQAAAQAQALANAAGHFLAQAHAQLAYAQQQVHAGLMNTVDELRQDMVLLPDAHAFSILFGRGPQHGMPIDVWAQTMLQQMPDNRVQPQYPPPHWAYHGATLLFQSMHQTLTALANLQMPNGAQQWPGVPGAPQWFGLPGGAVQGNGLWNVPGPAQQPWGVGAQANMPPVPAHNAPPAGPQLAVEWHGGFREGCWPNVIDRLSPGPSFDHYRRRDDFDPPASCRETPLLSIELKSCGYVRLLSAGFDQSALNSRLARPSNPFFERRRTQLGPLMMNTSDRYIGQIAQYMPERERNALSLAWGMRMGWEDARKAQEAEYDGFLPGGTGRVSGTVSKTTLVNASLADGRSG